jgi:hypothetical protein
VGLASFVFGASELVNGAVTDGLYFLAGGVLVLFIASFDLLTWTAARRRSTRFIRYGTVPESGEVAIVVPYSPVRLWAYVSLVGIAAVAFLALGVRERSALYVMVAVALAALLVHHITQICRKKIVCGHLAMSPSGMYHRSWASSSFVPWEHVSDIDTGKGDWQLIEVRVSSGAGSWSRRATRLLGAPPSSGLSVPGAFLCVDPVLVYSRCCSTSFIRRPDRSWGARPVCDG